MLASILSSKTSCWGKYVDITRRNWQLGGENEVYLMKICVTFLFVKCYLHFIVVHYVHNKPTKCTVLINISIKRASATCLQDPIHFGLIYTLEKWTYSATWIEASTAKRKVNHFYYIYIYIIFNDIKCFNHILTVRFKNFHSCTFYT